MNRTALNLRASNALWDGAGLRSPLALSRYTHPTKAAADFERDKYRCEKIAEQSVANNGAAGNPFLIVQEQKRCMELEMGWVPERSK